MLLNVKSTGLIVFHGQIVPRNCAMEPLAKLSLPELLKHQEAMHGLYYADKQGTSAATSLNLLEIS